MEQDDITQLIVQWQRGDTFAGKRLFDLLYHKLHRIAVHCVRYERNCATLGPTGLVHEAYLRFAKAELDINNRNHFLSLAARVMRRIIVDEARARLSEKRGGELTRADVSECIVKTDENADLIILIDEALDELAAQNARQAELVQLRYFGGYTIEESAAALGISVRTARRDWQVARTRLKVAIDAGASAR